MLGTIKHLWLGLFLIALASSLLLLSDLGHRKGHDGDSDQTPRIGVLQFASNSVLDETIRGALQGLEDQGYVDGSSARLKMLNAAGDNATLSTMAQELAGGQYDIIVTASTVALQAVASANRKGRTIHVFGAVTDPYGAGVGVTGPDPDQHPPHLVGVGTFQPVESAIEMAHAMNPKLKTIGTVWNPGEVNSEACVEKARHKCADLDLRLLEANASHVTDVPEAIRSVLSRGAECIWLGGDNIAASAISAIVSAAHPQGVPVITNDPGDVPKGAVFGVGAAYYTVGQTVGAMAGRILDGANPASFGVQNMVPEIVAIQQGKLESFDNWQVTPEIKARVRKSERLMARTGKGEIEPGRTYKVAVLYTSPDPIFERTINAMRKELAVLGFREGDNLEFRTTHANGELSALPQIAAAAVQSDADVIVPLSTPGLAATLARAQDRKIVFAVSSEPIEVGAGKTFDDHLPNVTGAVWTAPSPDIFRWLKELFPKCRTVGIIYSSGEANSIKESQRAADIMARHGMEPIVRTVSSLSEMPQAIESMMVRQPDAMFAIGDTAIVSSFSLLARECEKHGIPLVCDDADMMGTGGLLSTGPSSPIEGRRAARLIARVLLGENPGSIPFSPTEETETVLDLAAARSLGITPPVDLLKATDVYMNPTAGRDGPFEVALVNLEENPLLFSAEGGVEAALQDAGFRGPHEYVLKKRNAQGDMTQLAQVIDAVRAENPDLIITVTTAALINAARKVTDTPVVYTVASNPDSLGIFKNGRPANFAGVHDNPRLDFLVDMICACEKDIKIIGSVHNPSEPNAMISVRKLRKACEEEGLKLVEATASETIELPTATQSLIQRNAQAIVVSADNLCITGFPFIVKTADKAGVPVYVTEAELMKSGAAGAFGNDYGAWGRQSGRLAAKILAGVPPSELPLESLVNRRFLRPRDAAENADAPQEGLLKPTPWKIRAIRYSDTEFSEQAYEGFLKSLANNGLVKDEDFEIKCLNAQGDLATLSTIATSVNAQSPDLVQTISTPALQAALQQIKNHPVIFSCVASAVKAGAGKTTDDHRPNVTGITTRSPFEPMSRVIRQSVPNVRKVGTLFAPGEINSVLYRDWFKKALENETLELVAVPVNSSAEIAQAIDAMLRKDIQIVCQISDNLTRPAFAELGRRTAAHNIPFFCFDSAGMHNGATLILARDYYHAGIEAGEVAVRVLRGESPRDIPFSNTKTELLRINFDLAAKYKLTIPEDVAARARKEADGH